MLKTHICHDGLPPMAEAADLIPILFFVCFVCFGGYLLSMNLSKFGEKFTRKAGITQSMDDFRFCDGKTATF